MGKLSRNKGAAFEREMANLLTTVTGSKHQRQLTEVREGNVGDITGPLNLSVQCKVGAMPPIYAAVEQAQAAGRVGDISLALVRRNAGPGRKKVDLAVLPLDDFIELLAYACDAPELDTSPVYPVQ